MLGGGATEINARGLDAFMSHKVGKKGNVIELVEEVLGEAKTESVRIDYFTIQPILVCKMFQLDSDAPCGYTLPIAIKEDVAT